MRQTLKALISVHTSPHKAGMLEQGEALFSHKAMTHHHIKQKGT